MLRRAFTVLSMVLHHADAQTNGAQFAQCMGESGKIQEMSRVCCASTHGSLCSAPGQIAGYPKTCSAACAGEVGKLKKDCGAILDRVGLSKQPAFKAFMGLCERSFVSAGITIGPGTGPTTLLQFELDMTGVRVPPVGTVIEVCGSFNGWCKGNGLGLKMTQSSDPTTLWAAQGQLSSGTYEYKYRMRTNGGKTHWENVPKVCSVHNVYNNRVVTVVSSDAGLSGGVQ